MPANRQKIGKNIFILCLLGILSACDGTKPTKGNLISPFQQTYALRDSLTDPSCRALPQRPLRDLHFNSFYNKNDKTHSTIDKDAQKKYLEQTQQLRLFENQLATYANTYTLEGDINSGLCALGWLHEWAQSDAMLGASNAQGDFIRQWTLASLASAYAQVKNIPLTDARVKTGIEEWLSLVAERVRSRYPAYYSPEAKSDSLWNNHLYWGAWAVTIAGVAADRTDLYEWGVEKARYALQFQATKDGTFPLELKRGKKALQYHNFAMTPLIMIVETAYRNGDDLYGPYGDTIRAVSMRILENIRNPQDFESVTGTPQDRLDAISPEHFAWLEVYNARFPLPGTEDLLAQKRPVFSRRAGGNVTALFKKQSPASKNAVTE